MSRPVLILSLAALATLLTGCGPASIAAMHAERSCRSEVGPEPYLAAHLFGAAGLAVASAQPDWQEWNDRLMACRHRMLAGR